MDGKALLAALLIIGVLAGYLAARAYYAQALGSLRLEVEALRGDVSRLRSELNATARELEGARAQLAEARESAARLNETCASLRENNSRLLSRLTDLEEYLKSLRLDRQLFYQQVGDAEFYRGFTLLNYKTGRTVRVYVHVPADQYFRLRTNTTAHTKATIENRFTKDFILSAAYSYLGPRGAPVRQIAAQLRAASGGDAELYANLALQLVHELSYRPTLYTKYPLETLVEGSGDCDNLAVLLASILAAGGYDTLVVLVSYIWPNGTVSYHAVAAVALPEPPRGVEALGLKPLYITVYGEKFYLAEATWGTPGEPGYLPPDTEEALKLPQAYVGVLVAPQNASVRLLDYVYVRALPVHG